MRTKKFLLGYCGEKEGTSRECGDAGACRKRDIFQAVFMDGDKMNIRAIQRKGIAMIMDGKRNWGGKIPQATQRLACRRVQRVSNLQFPIYNTPPHIREYP